MCQNTFVLKKISVNLSYVYMFQYLIECVFMSCLYVQLCYGHVSKYVGEFIHLFFFLFLKIIFSILLKIKVLIFFWPHFGSTVSLKIVLMR